MNDPAVFRLAYVPGVMPAKWVRTFRERRPGVVVELVAATAAAAPGLVRAGEVDAALARPAPGGEDGLSVIRLYDETPVVVVPKDHLLTAADELTLADLAGEPYLRPLDDVLPPRWSSSRQSSPSSSPQSSRSSSPQSPRSSSPQSSWSSSRQGRWSSAVETPRPGTQIDHRPDTTADAVELVAAGLGVLVIPMSLARLHHRRDLTYRPLVDGPGAPVALMWPEPTAELVEEFIGVVRGRRPGSSRGQAEPAPKRTAKEKAAARRAAKEAAGTIPPRKPDKKGAKAPKPSARRTPRRGGR